MEQPTKELVEANIQNEQLQKFNVTDAAIAEMKEKFMPLTVASLDDKEGLKAVHDARMLVKGKRVEVEKVRKGLNAEALDWQKTVNTEAKRITALLEPIETHLEAEENKVEKEKERIQQEKDRLAQGRINTRIANLIAAGCMYDGVNYSLAHLTIDQLQIKLMDDQPFAEFMSAVLIQKEQEQAVWAEKERLKKEADDKLKADQKALEEAKKAQDEREKKFKEELEKLKEEKKKARITIILANGYTQASDNCYVKIGPKIEGANSQSHAEIFISSIEEMEDADFYGMISKYDEGMQKVNERLYEEVRIATRTKNRIEQLENMGLSYSHICEEWFFQCLSGRVAIKEDIVKTYEDEDYSLQFAAVKQSIGDVKTKELQRLADVEARREDDAKKAAAEKQKREQEEKEKTDREAKEESDRQEALRPDKEKLQTLANGILKIALPQVAGEGAQRIINDTQVMLGKIQTHILNKIKTL